MEEIIESLQSIEIDESLKCFPTLSREPVSCVNFQKCFIPPHFINYLGIVPGDPVTLLHRKAKFVLRAFQSFSNTNNIEVYGAVELETEENCIPFKLNKIEKLKKFNSINIDLVCDCNYVFMWLSKKEQLWPILERRILRTILCCTGSTVSLNAFPDSISFGVRKVVVVQTNTPGVGCTSSRTKINIQQIFTELQYQKNNNSSSVHVFGANRMLKEFTELIDINFQFKKLTTKRLPPIKQVLLAGPSGCGKSSIVRQLAHIKQCPVVKIMGQDIYHKDPGQAELLLRNMFREAFYYAKTEGICLVLIEDVDSICPSGKNRAPHTTRLSSQLMQLLDECQETPGIIVIATTIKPSDIHSGLRRHGRLAKEIFMGRPSENERMEIISNFLNMLGNFTNGESNEIARAIANITPGYLGADLKSVCQVACTKILDAMLVEDKVKFSIQILKGVLLVVKPASLRSDVEIVAGGTPAAALGGLREVKKQLELSVHCSLLQPHIYTRMGIQKPRGILLYGPPGCAKTSLAKTLASNGNITVLCATNASIYSPYVGDAEKAIVNLFHNARQNTPAVIFIDEIDSLVGTRSISNNSNDVQERVLAALLTQMDGIGVAKEVADYTKKCSDGDDVMVIAATNRPNEIDPALLRPGRFDRHIYVPPPDLESRLDILSIVTNNTPLDENVNLEEVARRTEYYSGADLKNLHTETVLFAMTNDGIDIANVKQSHYEEVLKVMKPSLSREIVDHFKEIF